MDERRILGNHGEQLAANYLKKQGYRILETGYTCKVGEIDIIAKNKEFLIFCEVKLRKTDAYGYPFESVNKRKQEKIRKIATYYFSFVSDRERSCRFDVISIEPKGDSFTINHLENAFT